jgi:uncharacterized protein
MRPSCGATSARDERARARELALAQGVPFAIVECVAEPDVLRARLAARVGDASEADAAVLATLSRALEPLDEDERAAVLPPAGATTERPRPGP